MHVAPILFMYAGLILFVVNLVGYLGLKTMLQMTACGAVFAESDGLQACLIVGFIHEIAHTTFFLIIAEVLVPADAVSDALELVLIIADGEGGQSLGIQLFRLFVQTTQKGGRLIVFKRQFVTEAPEADGWRVVVLRNNAFPSVPQHSLLPCHFAVVLRAPYINKGSFCHSKGLDSSVSLCRH